MQTDLVADSSCPVSLMKTAIFVINPPSSFRMCLPGAIMSAARSSTKRVGFTAGCSLRARSTALMNTILISIVARPDHAVMPLMANMPLDTTPPIRMTLSSRYTANDILSIRNGYFNAIASRSKSQCGTRSKALTKSSSAWA